MRHIPDGRQVYDLWDWLMALGILAAMWWLIFHN